MANKLSKAELLKNSKEYFEKYPKMKNLYATSDGTFFLEGFLNLAQLHGREIGEKPIRISRTEVISEKDKNSEKGKEKTKSKSSDPVKELVEKAIDAGVIIKAGSWLKHGDNGLAQGLEATVKHLKETPEDLKAIEEDLNK